MIIEGGISHLRMALLLLDNAAEVMMYRRMRHEFSTSRRYENMLESMKRLQGYGIEGKSKHDLNEHMKGLQNLIVPAHEKRKIEKYFHEKLKFLTQKKHIGESVASVLSATHRYRNNAHHQDKLRKETLQPVVLLLFEVVCDLLISLSPGWMSWSSRDNYLRFEERYGLSAMNAGQKEGLLKIRGRLREGLPLEFFDLRDDLVTHLEARLEDLMQAIQFIAENVSEKGDFDGALKHVEYWFPRGGSSHRPQSTFDAFVPRHNMSELESWKAETQALKSLNDRLVLFAEFARHETFLEPIEEMVYEAAAALDHAIDMEIDRMRGK